MTSKLLLSFLFVLPPLAHAWGRRGHQIVGETAAQLVVDEVGGGGLAAHSFDIAYYANIPDLQWKRPATFSLERPQHYMDMDVIGEAFKKRPEVKNPFALSRAEFDKTFPELEQNTGRAFWRVREMLTRLGVVSEKLKAPDLEKRARHLLQQEWIVIAGVMGHYVGDLGMPMHVVWDYDAEKTNQKGLHGFFEDVCVDFYYPDVAAKVMKDSKRAWPAFKKKNEKTDVLEMLVGLTDDSTKNLVTLLKVDKASDRAVKNECPKLRGMIERRLVASTLILAELYRRHLGWTFDNKQFFNVFNGEPAWIPLGDAAN